MQENKNIFSQEFTVYIEQESIESIKKTETESLDKGGLSKKDFTQNFLVLKYVQIKKVSSKKQTQQKN